MAINTASYADIPAYLLEYQQEQEKPCKHSVEPCPPCLHKRLHGRRWRIENPDRMRTLVRRGARRMRAKNPDGTRAYTRAWRKANPDKVQEYNRRCNARNGHRYASKKKDWKDANPEKASVSRRRAHEKRLHEDADAYREEWRVAQQRRRARMCAAFIEDVRYEEVYERDGGACHVCGLHVPEDSSSRQLRGTLDHVTPLAGGGLHEQANIKLAHSLCNSVKHANERVTEEKRRSLIYRIGAALRREGR